MNCECCGKEIKIFFSQTKYCNSCSIHNNKYHKKIASLKQRIKTLEKKVKKNREKQKMKLHNHNEAVKKIFQLV